ncbi:MAG: SBBP repeat-containing protein [Paludibacteraceae bacterium]|nr:SBBP repeat-containing protein [Paludibacteraceae bacterium]
MKRLIIFVALFLSIQLMLQAKDVVNPSGGLQFTSSGHILMFQKQGITVASASHAMNVKFVNARSVAPQGADSAATTPASSQVLSDTSLQGFKPGGKDKAAPLSRVTYSQLWKGVTVIYNASPGGIYESTYQLDPVGNTTNVGKIRLQYNRSISLDSTGNLVIHYPMGTLTESAPVAWQMIDGKKVPVPVAYKLYDHNRVGFILGTCKAGIPVTIDPTLTWNTFLGGSSDDYCFGIAVDASGNVYVCGQSATTWGAPIRAFSGGNYDGFVAKLTSAGVLSWNTFLGGTGDDICRGIALDASANVYVVGYSNATWGSPIRAFSGSYDNGFAAKLTSAGTLSWNTFLGGTGDDLGSGITVDASGNVYVCGQSGASWGTPIRAYSSDVDGFVAKLTSTGILSWNTFLGGTGTDFCYGITVDASGNVYVCGESNATWGAPIRAYTSGRDGFVAKLTSTGALSWNTFLGGTGIESCRGIALDASTNVYVCGFSDTWGTPIRDYTSSPFGGDGFVAKLTSAGALIWNTFLGGIKDDYGWGIALDASANIYVCGYSNASWGTPINAYTKYDDGFVAQLSPAGILSWNTFLGGTGYDESYGIALDASANVYICGQSAVTWGSPKRAFGGNGDGFVAKILTPPAVSTQAATAVNFTTATLNGNISSFGGTSSATAYGFCYSSTNTTPTTADVLVNLGTTSTKGAYSSSRTGLTLGTTYYVRAYATNSYGTSYGTVVTFKTLASPTVTSAAVTNITATSATGNGNISDLGGPASVTAYGVCYSKIHTAPTISDSIVNNGATTTTGAFTSSITGLSQNTTYYVRAYATNSTGTSYGNMVSFITLTLPTLAIKSVSSISNTNAIANWSITNLGNPASVTACGVCWSNTNSSPTIADAKIDKGAKSAAGAFADTLKGLTKNTTYYVRAYTINAAGTAYGAVVSFSTIPQCFTYTIQNEVQTSDKTLEFDLYLLNTDAATPIQIASVQSGVFVNAAIANGGTITASIVSGSSDMSSSQQPSAISSITSGSGYYVRIAAENYPGCGNGTIMSTTFPGTRVCRVKLSNTNAFSSTKANMDFNFSTIPYPTKVFYYQSSCSNIASIQLVTNSINCYRSSSANNPTLNSLPTVSTDSVINVNSSSVTANGTITASGSPFPTQLGFVYSSSATFSNPTTVTCSAGTSGVFTSSITGLSAGSTYYVKAFASNAAGTVYGDVIQFSIPTISISYTTPNSFSTGVPITALSPTVAGTIIGYSVSPALPAGLSMDVTTGVISGTPTAGSAATDYTVIGTYSSGSISTVVNISVTSIIKQLSVKAYLEGLWSNANANMNQCKYENGTAVFTSDVDTVIVELHSSSSYSNIVYSLHNVYIGQDGNIHSSSLTYLEIPSNYNGSYYITVKTRNHLATTSASAVSFAGNSISYDFTTAASMAYGSNMKLLATGVYGFYAGDVNQDGIINASDGAAIQTLSDNFINGYYPEDVDGDGSINSTDGHFVDNNNLISVSHP